MLEQLLSKFDLASMQELVGFWHAKGVTLALAEPIIYQCAGTIGHLRSTETRGSQDWYLSLGRQLLQNSARLINYDKNSTLSEFTAQFCGSNIRWETLGIFFSAVIRATFDIPFFPHLYKTEAERHELRSLVKRFTDASLDLCLSLDCLNDLQLVFHYESIIVQSHLHGDHNLKYYRSLGDVIASIFALGYHENIDADPSVPSHLVELRKTAFARVYSADKNVAIYLGRPPRMSKRFCYFQVPSATMVEMANPTTHDRAQPTHRDHDAQMNYVSETRWSAMCASIKEDVLELLFCEDRSKNVQKASGIAESAEALWEALPPHFRLNGTLHQNNDRTPFERDFLASTRLNYLHVRFLLGLVSLPRLTEPDTQLVDIAREMLALVVGTVLQRDRLVNSGTGLIWKIAYYGLPAAGMILLGILKQHAAPVETPICAKQVWRDLHVLVAEIQYGCIVQAGDPSYDLLFKATETIQLFLDSMHVEKQQIHSEASNEQPSTFVADDWSMPWSADPWNLEIGFWSSLAEHPFLQFPEASEVPFNNHDHEV